MVEHHLAKVRVAGSNPVVRSSRCSTGIRDKGRKTPHPLSALLADASSRRPRVESGSLELSHFSAHDWCALTFAESSNRTLVPLSREGGQHGKHGATALFEATVWGQTGSPLDSLTGLTTLRKVEDPEAPLLASVPSQRRRCSVVEESWEALLLLPKWEGRGAGRHLCCDDLA